MFILCNEIDNFVHGRIKYVRMLYMTPSKIRKDKKYANAKKLNIYHFSSAVLNWQMQSSFTIGFNLSQDLCNAYESTISIRRLYLFSD